MLDVFARFYKLDLRPVDLRAAAIRDLMNRRAAILPLGACIAAPLALGFGFDDASIRFTPDLFARSCPFDAAGGVRVAAGGRGRMT